MNNKNKYFLQKIINGDLGLGPTYWTYGFLVFVFVNIHMRAANSSFIYYTVGSLITIYSLLIMIGLWNAADKYKGSDIIYILAKSTVMLYFYQIVLCFSYIYGYI